MDTSVAVSSAPAPAARAGHHHAFVYDRYGGPEELRWQEVVTLPLRAEQVRVRVHATSLNAADVRLLRADPFLARLDNGLFRPRKRRVLGADVCGVVEEVGAGVTQWKVGDEVFGQSMAMGAFAESVCLRQDELVARPAGVSVEACAAAPLAAMTAIQAVRVRALAEGRPRPRTVLVAGAGGGVGTMLVQVAKAYGLEVTALCGPKSVELVRSLGADAVLDYTRDAPSGTFDVIFGVNGHRPLSTYRSWLAPGGLYLMVGGDNRQIFEALLLGPLLFLGSGKRAQALTLDAREHPRDLRELAELLERGRVRPVIDRVLPLAQLPEAIRLAESGHVRGKIVLRAG